MARAYCMAGTYTIRMTNSMCPVDQMHYCFEWVKKVYIFAQKKHLSLSIFGRDLYSRSVPTQLVSLHNCFRSQFSILTPIHLMSRTKDKCLA